MLMYIFSARSQYPTLDYVADNEKRASVYVWVGVGESESMRERKRAMLYKTAGRVSEKSWKSFETTPRKVQATAQRRRTQNNQSQA